MTYHPDSVLVEKVAKATRGEGWPPLHELDSPAYEFALGRAREVLMQVGPLVAGVIADRLERDGAQDEYGAEPWNFVRREFVDGEA